MLAYGAGPGGRGGFLRLEGACAGASDATAISLRGYHFPRTIWTVIMPKWGIGCCQTPAIRHRGAFYCAGFIFCLWITLIAAATSSCNCAIRVSRLSSIPGFHQHDENDAARAT
ncbi:hypothetical protein D8I24_3297 [Cupriavidus necator H850]|nr:hypothetical protein D8I24_3297 [Cupriavidus necator H850]